MKQAARTKQLNIRVSPELLELLELVRTSPYGRSWNNSISDIIHTAVATYARKEVVFPGGKELEKALSLANKISK